MRAPVLKACVGACAIAFGFARGQSVGPAPTGCYRLDYEVVDEQTPSKSAQLAIIECSGQLKCTLSQGASQSTFIYDGKMSFCTIAKDSAMYMQGFHFELFPVRFYPPFSFQSHALYADKERVLAKLSGTARQKIARLEPECNISVFRQTAPDGERFTLGSLRGGPDGNLEILLGSRTIPDVLLRYSSFRAFAGARVPGIAEMLVYREVKNGAGSGLESVHFVVDRQLRLRLLSARRFDANSHAFDVQSSIPTGTLVSYSGDRGQCGVVYNPSAGTLQEQIAGQLKVYNIKGSKLIQTATLSPQRGQVPLVPLVLSASFGLFALLLLLKRRR